jgi:hypothetical protein
VNGKLSIIEIVAGLISGVLLYDYVIKPIMCGEFFLF